MEEEMVKKCKIEIFMYNFFLIGTIFLMAGVIIFGL